MPEPRVVIGTLCLNEMEHLRYLYQQHKDWPGLEKWVFVESADESYRLANPHLVSPEGLSVDGTSEYLKELAAADPRIVYVPFGISKHPKDPAQAKCQSRQQYLEVANEIEPELVIVLDADEFYLHAHQGLINTSVRKSFYDSFCYLQRNIWRPHSVKDHALFNYEVVGGFWDIPHCRVWRWYKGMFYENNHNHPGLPDGTSLGTKMKPYFKTTKVPACIHLGYASNRDMRVAKAKYYTQRGEGRGDRRAWYVESRAAFERWRPGLRLPYGAKVVPYNGPIPECFRE